MYPLCSYLNSLNDIEAISSVGSESSPITPRVDFHDLPQLSQSDDDDFSYIPTGDQKCLEVLAFMTHQLSRFSLRTLLETLFSSEDSTIKHHANIFLAGGGPHQLMNLCQFQEWVVEKAAEICSQECPYYADALSLCVSPKNVTFDLVKKMKSIILTLVVLPVFVPLKTRCVNLHPAITCLIMWDNQVPKRVVQLWNRYGASSSHPFQGRAIFHLSQDSLCVTQAVANDGTKIKQLPYDNFNWMSQAWEVSAIHGSAQHDQVSAMLVVLPRPEDVPASYLANVARFDALTGS
ncbi:uncharacterized protein EDB91DRAFT_1238597 [Suillus paluster]|uniref:uncharacterized protein n=1 Tax=Suillus paluster TaxID=48578 RepID=UPI001B886226|nr:uncharacterized protein EDB91DRAFT_1238597 [Suillus paluster]KAG1733357.1 hypothetical protein EDB91DRAFT_1238597 [Suillus paluster]